jgi:peptidoglycan hydrolase-like protein with peptidoglycan-binding domain
MARSQNGYEANNRDLIEYNREPGSTVGFNNRKGAVAVVMTYLAQEFDDRVEDLDTAGSYEEGDNPPSVSGGSASTVRDDWSYAERKIRGGVSLSNHASGTADDMNSTQHPLGKSGTFTNAQVDEIEDILHDLVDPVTKESVVRWGGHYSGRKDEMHFEIDADLDAVGRVADRIKKGDDGKLYIEKLPSKPKPKPKKAPEFPLPKGHWFGVESSDSHQHSGYWAKDRAAIKMFEKQLLSRGWNGVGTPNGTFGKKTEEVVKQFQDEKGLKADGLVGPKTWSAAWTEKVT